MEAGKLYQQLERDFVKPQMSDDWWRHMESIGNYVCDNFKQRSIGLVCDFAPKINKIFTAVFPSDAVMEKIINDGAHDAMLFVHHPMAWDIKNAEAFSVMDRRLLEKFKKNRISVFNFHVPLDNFGPYSTSVSFAKALGFEITKPFAPYFGALCGVFCQSDISALGELKKRFDKTIGHETHLRQYGLDKINNEMIAIVAGGGNGVDVLQEMAGASANVLITGITAKNEISKPAHDFAQEHKINLLGGTHYSTEKFACLAMVDYFKNLGLPAEFIADVPCMEDM